jgi:hypothetical protein
MTRVFLGLTTQEGDRLGHLVRGVQMLRSYGEEARVIHYSDVVDWTGRADEQPLLGCVLECMSDATLEGLHGICRETQWALGDEDRVLKVYILKYGTQKVDQAPEPLQALLQGKFGPNMTVSEGGPAFAHLCDWGQVAPFDGTDLMGEWPSATGR